MSLTTTGSLRIFTDPDALREHILAERDAGKTIGLVPTMGALHAGHESLIARARSENDVVVVTIFVNPRQFDDPRDLEAYPRTPETDAKRVEAAGADLLLMPTPEMVYPEGEEPEEFELGTMSTLLEGAQRQGHYLGVAQVISKLVSITWPDRMYLGQKDYQQYLVISRAVHQILGPVPELVLCPTLREPSGLAMSSRNVRLSPHQRQVAAGIYRVLQQCQTLATRTRPVYLSRWAEQQLNAIEGCTVDYACACDARSLRPLDLWPAQNGAMMMVAVRLGGVRLIDNIVLISPAENMPHAAARS